MTNNRPGTKGVAEENRHKNDENKHMRDGVTGNGQELAEEDALQINEDVEGALKRKKVEEIQVQDFVQGHSVIPRLQQQSEEPLVHWERFLPLRSLKVLLVEYDDSTRQVVGALLRNCGYEVTAVANGLQAWKILEDRPNHIDLVLTEVVMPSLSGIGLLCQIMSHKTCKNIPVIMMSSHDSMSIVFKCLSRGAVDFLVKPIRKNELKNLWQHVWRKCHSSSGSGSESGIRTQKSTKSKSCEDSDNNTGSNDEDDIESIDFRNGSDNGSGTQSSWTKRAVEIESPQKASSWEQLADPPDSTFAQVIHARPDTLSSNWVPMTKMRNAKGKYDELGLVPFQDRDMMGKDMEIGAPNLQPEETSKRDKITADPTADETSEVGHRKNNEQLEDSQLELNSEKPNAKAGAVTNGSNPAVDTVNLNIGNGLSKVSDVKDKAVYDTKEMPSLELSLKRMKDDVESNPLDKNVLRHSGLSAFSRYNSSTPNQTPTGNVGSCSSADNSSGVDKSEYLQNFQSNSSSPPLNQGSNGSSNNNDVGSTTNNAFTKLENVTDKPPSMLKYLHQSSAFQPLQNCGTRPQPAIEGKVESAMAHVIVAQGRGTKHHVQVQHHHHHYHLHHHHHQQNEPAEDHDMVSKSTATAAPQCGSSNVLSTPYEGIVANDSCNRSASGSNHASNGQNVGNLPTNDQETNMDGDNKVAEESGANGGIGYTNRNGVEQSRNAQREAALNKFRQKRKERCFEKKVRYQSRKKLAEQRPRVRGQFVRQAVNEIKGQETSS